MPDSYTDNNDVLRNIPGLTDPQRARQFEVRMAYQRDLQLADHPIQGSFDLAHLQAIHRHLFQDVWTWAGRIRTVDTGTVGTNLAHARPAYIEEQARFIFRNLARDSHLRDMDSDTFADRLGYHWGEITALHPFRDGNTRTQRIFVNQLTLAAGHVLDWRAIDEELEQLKETRLIAHAGDHRPLAAFLRAHLDTGR